MKACRTVVLSAALVATLVLTWPATTLHAAPSSRKASATRTATDTVPAPLAKLAEGFEHLTSLHFRAVARVTRASGKTGGGVFEYWMSGDKFRTRCKTSKTLGLVPSLDLSWTGRTSFLYLDDDNFTFGGKRRTWAPTAIPNPLLLVYHFLEPADISRLHQFDVATLYWLQRPDAWRKFAAEALKQGNKIDASSWRVEIAHGDHPITVELHSDCAAGLLVDRITEPAHGGTMVVSVPGYNVIPLAHDHGVVAIPRTVKLTAGLAKGGPPVQVLEYRISLVTVDHPIPARVFVLKPKPGAHLWDEDQRKFVKKLPSGH